MQENVNGELRENRNRRALKAVEVGKKLGKGVGKKRWKYRSVEVTSRKENDGAIPGSYRVTLTPPPPSEIQADRRRPRTKLAREIVDPRYAKSETTDLAATVVPQNNDSTLRGQTG